MRKYPPPQVFILLFVFLFSSLSMFAQTRTLTGVVKDSANQPLVAATVAVAGSKLSTTTAADGSFTLNAVPAGNVTLEVTYIGYNPVSIPVGPEQTDVTIAMTQGSNTISDVVVTALGITKQERKLGYSVTAVNGDQLNKARETNIANSLAGQVAGLSVRGTNSGPGGTSKLLLRGLPSMNSAGSPLYVINGIPMDNTQRGAAGEWGGADNGDGINNINPDDVETMTVLKGQAASALYGARATNGVIMITTKGGKKGRKDFTVEYNMNYMAESPVNLTDFQYEYGQGSLGAKPTNQTDAISQSYSAWGAKLDGSQVIGYDGNNYAYAAVKYNIQNFYQTGNSFTNTLSISKSTESGAFRLGMSYLDNSGIVRNTGLNRYNISLNLDQNITDKLSVQAFVNYINQENQNISYLSDAPMNVNNVRFLAPNIDQATLAPGYDAAGLEMVVGGIYSQNPWFVVNKLDNDTERKRLITALTLKYNFTSWLYAMGRVGYDLINDNAFKAEPWGTAYRNTTVNNTFASGYLQNLDKSQQYELNVDGIIGANHKFNEIEVNALVGANLRKNGWSWNHLYGGPFIQPDFYSYNNLYFKYSEADSWATEVHSAYYSVDATFRNFLTVGTTGRLDAYSTMPANSNTIFVPAVTAGFIFTELMDNKGILNYGKFRASYANTSNELKEAYRTQTYYSIQTNNYNGIPLAQYDLALPNGLLKPFVVSEIELGADLHFFNNRLNLDVAWFTKKTKNEIMGATLSRSTGYGSGFVGTGSTKNSGIEILISGTIVQAPKFSWRSSLNFTSIESEIISTTEDNSNINLGQARETLGDLITAYVVGMEGPQIMGYDYRRDASGNIIVDASGLPLRATSLTPLGSVLPTFYGGWNNEFSFAKNFNFSFLIDYNFGNKLISMTSRSAMSAGLTKETLNGREGGIVVDGVTEAGDKNTENVTSQSYYSALASRITALHVMSGDFIKLRQVALTYNFPAELIRKTKVFRGAQISLTGRNLLILYKDAENIDPEESFGSSIQYYGIEGRNLPPTRAIGVNLKVNF